MLKYIFKTNILEVIELIINSLNPNKDNYKLDEVNCFEKSIGIILDSYNDKFSSLFYMLLKLCQSYNMTNFLDDSSKFELSTFLNIVNKFFNIHCEEVTPVNFNNFIEENLTNKNRVLVPGNLKELYYSNYYKVTNWPHLFVITGFDSQQKIFNIIDNIQFKPEISKFDNFTIEYNTLQSLFESYYNNYYSNKIIIFHENNNFIHLNHFDILIKILSIYLYKLHAQPYKEVDQVNFIIDTIKNSDYNLLKVDLANDIFGNCKISEYTTYMINGVKRKNVFFIELITNIKYFVNDNNIIESLNDKRNSIISSWEKIINTSIVNIYRCKTFDLQDTINNVISLEEEFSKLILSLKYYISSSNDNIKRYENVDNSV